MLGCCGIKTFLVLIELYLGMTTNPFINALAALGYIVAVVLLIFYGGPAIGPKDTVFIPMAMLSLFVFSAGAMSYIVLYQPVVMFWENKKAEATGLFLKTIGILGGFAAVLFALQLARPQLWPPPPRLTFRPAR
jgi:hypothetical protein